MKRLVIFMLLVFCAVPGSADAAPATNENGFISDTPGVRVAETILHNGRFLSQKRATNVFFRNQQGTRFSCKGRAAGRC